ncbi:MAG: TIGR00730 family Rossman fold protein [Lachnospiraceae bacterium]|nr:TIGR00730 family Rossman fold protein [Lachnospiraceae bacterium]
MVICAYGGASAHVDPKYIEDAYEAGRMIGLAGAGLVYGGGGTGCMGAVGRGVRDAGGPVTSVLPVFMTRFETLLKPVTETVVTESMSERKHVMEERADAFLVLPGGIGTLDEFFETLTLKSLERFSKPIVLLNTNGFFDPLEGLLRDYVSRGFVNARIPGLIRIEPTPEAAVRFLLGACKKNEEQVE